MVSENGAASIPNSDSASSSNKNVAVYLRLCPNESGRNNAVEKIDACRVRVHEPGRRPNTWELDGVS